jgi:serine/threonine protein kinase
MPVVSGSIKTSSSRGLAEAHAQGVIHRDLKLPYPPLAPDLPLVLYVPGRTVGYLIPSCSR